MKVACLLATVMTCGIASVTAHAQQPAERAQPASPAQPGRQQERHEDQPSPQEMDAAWREAMAPGEAHKRLDVLVGRWDTQITTWFGASSGPTQSTGVARYEWTLRDPEARRGRFLREEFRAELMGMPYHGLGYLGHDNIRGEYTLLWMDSMSTSTTLSTGTYDETTRTFTFNGSYREPEGREWQLRMVLTLEDDSRHIFEYFRSAEGVPEHKGMQVVYTRARPGAGEDRERTRPRDRPRDPSRPDQRRGPGQDRDGDDDPPRPR